MSFIAVGLGIGGVIEAGTAISIGAAEALGAGIGALTNPKDPLKGALIGGATGLVGGGIGAGIGALGGAAAGEVGATAADVAESSVAPTVTNASGTTVGDEVTGTMMNQVANAGGNAAPAGGVVPPPTTPPVAPTAAPTAPTPAPSMFDKAGSALFKQAAPEVLKTGAGMVSAPSFDNSGQQKIEEHKAAAQDWGSFADGGLATIRAARGGSVHLRNGDFIIPADVVSALGNGSTKAGAKYLTHLFNSLHAGPPPKAGSLAKRRAKERHAA